jgi:hypothetical protein
MKSAFVTIGQLHPSLLFAAKPTPPWMESFSGTPLLG